jgi:transitional endoplasmic reticulum ATPase
MSTQKPTEAREIAAPSWFEEYKESYIAGAAHGFVLSGDIYGFTPGGISQRGFLEAALAEKREIVVRYDRSRGFSFVLESMKEKAGKLVESANPTVSKEGKAMLESIDSILGAVDFGTGATNNPFEGQPQPTEALRLLESLMRNGTAKGKVAVILDFAELLSPNVGDKSMMPPTDRDVLGILMGWGQDNNLAKCNNPIFLLVAKLPELHADLRSSVSGYKVIDVPLPVREERAIYITNYLVKREDRKKPIPLVDLTMPEFANLTAGLNLRHLEDILLLAYRSGGVSRALVKARKDAIITSEYSEIAEMIEPLDGGFANLGGMDHLTTWARSELITPLVQGSPDVPKGVLLVGPPGTGKTFFVRALAAEVGFNAVMLRSENILSKWLGESEAKLKKFFDFARALTPCLVFFDELDQSDMSSRGNSGNPAGSNLFNQMLQFMSDETLRGKMVAFFASNRPDLIDSALLRFGRMDAIIPVLLPDDQARASIAKAQSRSQGMEIADAATNLLATRSVDYSAADIAAVISKAKKLARRAQRSQITEPDVEAALGFIRPSTPQIARKYTLLAVDACNDAELLPPEYATELADRFQLKAKIREAEQDLRPRPGAREDREDRSW